MPKHTRIYTRTGDDGTTGLVGGQRVRKTALRIEAYGTIDELSSALGLVRVALSNVRISIDATATQQTTVAATEPNAADAAVADAASRVSGAARRVRESTVPGELDRWLAWTQDTLFNLGSELATLPQDRWEGMPLIGAGEAQALERAIDRAEHDLEPLATFILPGGSHAGALLHLARTIARRAERLLVALAEEEPISPDVARYVNRLSDALFVWARWINHALGAPEAHWNPKTVPPD